jgi:hypothetical protein
LNPPPSSSLAEEEHLRLLLLRAAARDFRRSHLGRADLPRLRAAGQLGQLLARQSEAHGKVHQMEQLGREHPGLPDDLLNFQYDPVACAVALGWSGAAIEDIRLRPRWQDGVLSFQPHPEGRSTRVVLEVDGAAFRETWLSAVEAASS